MQAGVMKNKKVQGGQWGVSVWRLINTQGRLCLALWIDLMAKPLAPSLCDIHTFTLFDTHAARPLRLLHVHVHSFRPNRWHSFNRASWSHLHILWEPSLSLIWLTHKASNPAFCLIYYTYAWHFYTNCWFQINHACCKDFCSYRELSCQVIQYILVGLKLLAWTPFIICTLNFPLTFLFHLDLNLWAFLLGRTDVVCCVHAIAKEASFLEIIRVNCSFLLRAGFRARRKFSLHFFAAVVCGYRWKNSYFKDRGKKSFTRVSARVSIRKTHALCSLV